MWTWLPWTLLAGCDGCRDKAPWITWVRIDGGEFAMGSPDGVGDADEHPRHTVHIATFDLMKTEVDVKTWDACVAEGDCTALPEKVPPMCRNKGPDEGRGCLTWDQAVQVCDWLGGRLPSEAEWEFAARSRGEERTYPWGEAQPTCDLAVLGYTDNDP